MVIEYIIASGENAGELKVEVQKFISADSWEPRGSMVVAAVCGRTTFYQPMVRVV